MSENETPIALSLFDRISEYARSVLDGTVTVDSPLKQDTAIIVFCQNFFAQFFEHVLNHRITGFHQAAQREAVRLRRSLIGAAQAPVRAVIVQFEKFSATWSNLGAGGYEGSLQEFLEFHKVFIPRLLRSITAWAASRGLTEVAERAKNATEEYAAAAAHLEED